MTDTKANDGKDQTRKKSNGNITSWLVDEPSEKDSKDHSDGSEGAVRGDRKRSQPM
jgi:hypothetical protein